jgi:hypothetical protein
VSPPPSTGVPDGQAGTGAPDGDRSPGGTGTVINPMSPKTDTTCACLCAFARDRCLDEEVIATRLAQH